MSQNSHDKEYEEWYEYTTSQGDTFDALALDLYDDETLSSEIIRENPKEWLWFHKKFKNQYPEIYKAKK